jgi:hypothetical protein
MKVECKDCEAVIDVGDENGPALIRAGWHFIKLTDDENDEANGWRCPECVAGWDTIADSATEPRH